MTHTTDRELDWISVSYRSVYLGTVAVLLVMIGGVACWYYLRVVKPPSAAAEAIRQARLQLEEASIQGDDPERARVLHAAVISLQHAELALREQLWEEARISAIRAGQLASNTRLHNGEMVGDLLVARFLRLAGDVRVKRAGEFSWEAADAEMTLQVGDQIKNTSRA